MTQQQKLEALIEKAIESGWYVRGGKVTEMHFLPNAGKGIWSQIYTWQKETDNQLGTGLHVVGGLYDFIFNHDFAKALFGDDMHTEWSSTGPDWSPLIETDLYEWQYHLQQAVISDDPIGTMYEAVK